MGRINPLFITLIGVAVGSLYSWLVLHKQVMEMVKIGLISGLGANIIWFVGLLVYNTVRVPWLLDAESGGLINEQEKRAQVAEGSLAEMRDVRKKHDLFGALMLEGQSLYDEFNRTSGNWDGWLERRKDWVERVSKAFRDIGLPTDAEAFRQAENVTLSVQNETVDVHMRRLYKEQMRSLQAELKEIVRRRLS